MSGLLRDRDIDEALGVQEEFLTLLQSRGEKSGVELDRLEDAVVRRCLAVSGTNQVRAAAVDGLEGRRAAGFGAVRAVERGTSEEGEPTGALPPVSPDPKGERDQ